MALLYSHVPSRVALDVGANVGRVSSGLLDIGYEVYAFEPLSKAVETLSKDFGKHPRLHIFAYALGSEEAHLPLHLADGLTPNTDNLSLFSTLRPHSMPEGLKFSETTEVTVSTIEKLVELGELPKDLGLVKIDTEGFDLEVIRGMGKLRPPIVVTEFWGEGFVFSKEEGPPRYSASEILSTMRQRGYWWSLIIYRIDGSDVVRYTNNSLQAPKKAWGNIFFFLDHTPFIQAAKWCELVLPGLAEGL
jgi:FkbM family methyltransferase